VTGFYKSPNSMSSKELKEQRKNETDPKQKERLEKESFRRNGSKDSKK